MTVPRFSVVVVVVSVAPVVPVAAVVEVVDVCAKATEPMKAVANATLRNDLIIMNFLITELLQRSQLKANRFVFPNEFGEPGSEWMRQLSTVAQ